jgi:hypothetical protein
MKCCVRDGKDIPPPPYIGGYGDWPKITCVPGYRKDVSLPSDHQCILCDSSTYCPMRDDHIRPCPPFLTSKPGSSALEDCWCSPGYYGRPGAQACFPCPAGSFCPGQREPVLGRARELWPGLAHACPQGADTDGHIGRANCTCAPGTHGGLVTDDAGGCAPCPADAYCPGGGGPPVPCDDGAARGARSPPGSADAAQCACGAGLEAVAGECITACVARPGAYCAAGAGGAVAIASCPPGFYCEGGRGADRRPCVLPAGNYCPAQSAAAEGTACPADSYCPGGAGGADGAPAAQPCPAGSTTAGRTGQVACACVPGYHRRLPAAAGAPCAPCAAGSYCPGGEEPPRPCDAHATSLPGSASAGHCTCAAGYEPAAAAGGECVTSCVAPPGSFCQAPPAPSAGASAPAAAEPADPPLTAQPCPAGSYCPGGRGAGRLPCAAPSGRYCMAGAAAPAGAACPAGFFCPGGERDMVECAVEPGRYCPDGSSGPGGVPCPAGSYCTGGAADRAPCASPAGSFCPEGSRGRDGLPCPVGFACAGSSSRESLPSPSPLEPPVYCPSFSLPLLLPAPLDPILSPPPLPPCQPRTHLAVLGPEAQVPPSSPWLRGRRHMLHFTSLMR